LGPVIKGAGPLSQPKDSLRFSPSVAAMPLNFWGNRVMHTAKSALAAAIGLALATPAAALAPVTLAADEKTALTTCMTAIVLIYNPTDPKEGALNVADSL
jgi:hypothetical protein